MRYTPEEAINFTRRSVALLVCWPPSMKNSKRKLFLIDAYYYTSFVIALLSMAVLLNGMYQNRDDLEIIIQSTCIGLAILQMCVKSMSCRVKRSNLQIIVTEMENIVKQAQPYERIILTKYVNRCALLHMTITFGFYLSATAIIIGPIFLPQPFPTFAIYPFKVDYYPIYEMIYFQQVFTALQASAAASCDCLAGTLLWFAGARFEMLKVEITNVLNNFDLNRCIHKHQHIIRYAENVIQSVRAIIFATVGVSAMLMIFGGILFLFTDATMIKFQFSVMIMVSIIQLFISSYPAENLLEMSNTIGLVAYNLDWINKSRNMWMNIYIMIQRSQKPVKVSVGGFLPSLSLTYYMSFLSSSFSYFTTLRATVQ